MSNLTPQAFVVHPDVKIKHFLDFGYTVAAIADEYHVDYMVYQILWTEERKSGVETPAWPTVGATSNGDGVYKLEEAQPFLHGSVRFDHCSNWWFDEQDRGTMLHGCNRHDIENIGKIMAACWDWTEELLSKWLHPHPIVASINCVPTSPEKQKIGYSPEIQITFKGSSKP